jgi:flagellar hook-associated protein 3 FlgL
MRITQESMTRRLLADLQASRERVDRAQREMMSQKQLLKPSDDPVGAQRAILTRGELDANVQHQANVTQARGWMETTDDAYSEIIDILHRARALTVQGANDATGPAGRENIALEIDQLVSAVKQAANTSFGGVYVLAGTETTTRPYDTETIPPDDTYAGNAGIVAREIGPGISIQINSVPDDGSATPLLGSGGGDGGLIDTLRNISAHLRGGAAADADALRSTDLAALERNLDGLNTARANVGATVNRLDAADARLGATELAATKLLSEIEDVDFAQAALNLSSQQSVYDAALRTGARIIQPSLLDFLR